ncbi:hypothetical protein [Stutzerimonas stutzeri]|uniref:hypothetical protein n=1 Tax=Stutzerimonas stutzeri TaxID=316 RepID=UPI001CFE9F0E|nr:hypothetical protein [Stutzerimonas stutzeri]
MPGRALITFLLTLLVWSANPAHASDSPRDLCVVEGYFMQTDSIFMAGLANRYSERNGVHCLDSQRAAYFEGKALAKRVFADESLFDGRFTHAERRIFDLANEFQDRVNDFVLDGISK